MLTWLEEWKNFSEETIFYLYFRTLFRLINPTNIFNKKYITKYGREKSKVCVMPPKFRLFKFFLVKFSKNIGRDGLATHSQAVCVLFFGSCKVHRGSLLYVQQDKKKIYYTSFRLELSFQLLLLLKRRKKNSYFARSTLRNPG